MAGIDTDIYSTLGSQVKPFNALDAVATFAQAQNALNQNKLFQLETSARQAIGQVMKDSIGANGQIDYDKAAILLSTNKDTAWKAPEIINQWISQQKTKADTVKTNLENAAAQQTAYGNAATGLLVYGKDVTRGRVSKAVAELYNNGLIGKDEAVSYLAALPQDGPELYKHLQSLSLRAMGAAEAAKTVSGSIVSQEAGGNIIQQQQIPFLGVSKPVGIIEKTLTPAELNENTQVTDPLTGDQYSVPRWLAQPNKLIGGSGTVTNPLMGRDAGSNLPAGGAQGGQEAGQVVTPSPAPSSPFAGFPLKELNPATKEYRTKAGADVAEMEKNLNSTVDQGTSMLRNMQAATDALKKFTPGGGAETYQKLAAVMQGLGIPQATVDKVAGGDRAAAQIFTKSVMQVVIPQLRQAMQGLGQMNMLEFESILKANPNIETDPRAIPALFDFIKKGIALAQTKQQAFSMWKGANKDPTRFEAAFQKLMQDKGISQVNFSWQQ